MKKCFSDIEASAAVPILPVEKDRVEEFLKIRPEMAGWARAVGFKPEFGRVLPAPGQDGKLSGVLLCLGGEHHLWAYAAAAQNLPEGDYRIEAELDREAAAAAALGWALGTYAFDRYKSEAASPPPCLVPPGNADIEEAERIAGAVFMVRDMIATPAEEMGPGELARIGLDLFQGYGGTGKILKGEELIEHNFPAIHRVGRGSLREPRLIDLHWGPEDGPKVTLVGKGVCFDSGGLDLKNAKGMLDMRGDMGGAAHALGLARLIMGAGLEVRLRVLIPAVENMPSGNSYRPGDIIRTRQGIFVEISNTDAEGRVILSDALSEGASEQPGIMIDFATLTGAARVALGPGMPAVFSNRDDLAADLVRIGAGIGDPLWHLPLYRPYRKMLDSTSADIRNANTDSPAGGAITAALFLEEFAGRETPWIHLDIPSFHHKPDPGHPEGADAFGLRSSFALIRERFQG